MSDSTVSLTCMVIAASGSLADLFDKFSEGDWYPFRSKAVSTYLRCITIQLTEDHNQVFLMTVIFNSPRMRFSQPQQQAVHMLLTELGVPGIPSLPSLASDLSAVVSDVKEVTKRCVSAHGNVFYVNQIGSFMANVSFSYQDCLLDL